MLAGMQVVTIVRQLAGSVVEWPVLVLKACYKMGQVKYSKSEVVRFSSIYWMKRSWKEGDVRPDRSKMTHRTPLPAPALSAPVDLPRTLGGGDRRS